MDPRHSFIDKRLVGHCVYCGDVADTGDHVPSKVLIDTPYPRTFPVVEACEACNQSFSKDEEYLACFVECVIAGSTETSQLQRPNVKRILDKKLSIQKCIENSKRPDSAGRVEWLPKLHRVRTMVLKLARGHVAYELHPKLEEPIEVKFAPLLTLGSAERIAFENFESGDSGLWPEVGSRAFLREAGLSPDRLNRAGDWVLVQPDRYRYLVTETDTGAVVRIVLSEYLACEVIWDSRGSDWQGRL